MNLPRLWLLAVASSLLIGCAAPLPVKYPRHPLVDQILTMRPTHEGLTNNACVQWDEKNACVKFDIQEYSLGDASFRHAVNDFGFVCLIGGRRFKVCQDKPGFCRHSYKRGGFLRLRKKKTEEYRAAADREYLLRGGTVCASKDRYPLFNAWGSVPFGGLGE